MRTFLCEIDHTGLRRFIPEELLPADELCRLVNGCRRCPTSLFWTLLGDDDAEEVRVDIGAGRHAEACGLILNRAVEITSLSAAFGTPRRSYLFQPSTLVKLSAGFAPPIA